MAKTKALEAQVTKTTSLLENAMEESASEITALKAEVKTKTDLLEVIKPKNNIPVQKDSSTKEAEVEVSTEKCRMCGFSAKSEVVIRQHMVSRHGLTLVQEKSTSA